jgi:hypothetical protein
MSPSRAFLLALGLGALALGGCDLYDDDDGGFDDPGLEAVYVDFALDRDDYFLSEDGLVASFESSDINDSDEREAVEDALLGADEGAIVLLYVDGSLLFENGGGTWTALPVTRAYEAVGDDGVPYVDYTVTYSYSYDDGDLYFDVFSSAELDFDTVLPGEIFCRLVTLPAFGLRANAGLDLTDYEAVRQAFALPE